MEPPDIIGPIEDAGRPKFSGSRRLKAELRQSGLEELETKADGLDDSERLDVENLIQDVLSWRSASKQLQREQPAKEEFEPRTPEEPEIIKFFDRSFNR